MAKAGKRRANIGLGGLMGGLANPAGTPTGVNPSGTLPQQEDTSTTSQDAEDAMTGGQDPTQQQTSVMTKPGGGMPPTSGSIDPTNLMALMQQAGLNKPNWVVNLMTQGRAGMNYQQMLGNLLSSTLGQQAATGRTQLEQAGATQRTGMQGTQAQTLAQMQIDAAKSKAFQDEVLALASKSGVPINSPDDLANYTAALSPEETKAAVVNAQNKTQQAGMFTSTLNNPNAQPSLDYGFNMAAAGGPQKISAQPGSAEGIYPFPGAQPITAFGSQPLGGTSSKRMTLDPKTGMPVTTESSTTTIRPPVINGSDDTENALRLFQQQQGNGQGGEGDSLPNTLQTTPPVSAQPNAPALAPQSSVSAQPFSYTPPSNPMSFGHDFPTIAKMLQYIMQGAPGSTNPNTQGIGSYPGY